MASNQHLNPNPLFMTEDYDDRLSNQGTHFSKMSVCQGFEDDYNRQLKVTYMHISY